jgi:hypothetical protein
MYRPNRLAVVLLITSATLTLLSTIRLACGLLIVHSKTALIWRVVGSCGCVISSTFQRWCSLPSATSGLVLSTERQDSGRLVRAKLRVIVIPNATNFVHLDSPNAAGTSY